MYKFTISSSADVLWEQVGSISSHDVDHFTSSYVEHFQSSLLSCFSPSRKGLSPEMVRPPLASDLPPGPWRSETAPWLSFRSLALCSISSVKCTLHIVRDAGLQDLLKLLLQKVHMCDFSSVCSVFMWCLRSLLRIKFATNCSTFLYGILGNYSERRFCSKLYMHARSFPHESTLCAG